MQIIINMAWGILVSSFELLKDMAPYLLFGFFVAGILIGGVITWLLPDDFFGGALEPGLWAILLMVLISVPIYVRATGSIPIAAALMLKGLNPGAAFVFLLAGPATNSVTITVISRFLGKKSTTIYLTTLILSSIGLGLLLDAVWTRFGFGPSMSQHHQHQLLPTWLEWGAAFLLLALLIFPAILRMFSQKKQDTLNVTLESNMQSTLLVPGMTCHNCVNHVKSAVQGVDGVESVVVDLKTKKVDISYKDDIALGDIVQAIVNSGYEVKNN